MNREKKNRIRCANCIFFEHDIFGLCHCEQKPEYIIDVHTRRPDWCPLRQKSKEVTDEQLRWVQKTANEVAIRNDAEVQVNINDFIPEIARDGYGLVESEEA